jgi:uncharacterized protein YndB with AHSA1/START domain
MTPQPTGRLTAVGEGRYDLVVKRNFEATGDDVWASITEPERTARWFGTWEGDGAAGNTVRLQMGFEEGDAWSEVRIEACEPPSRLALTVETEMGAWRLEALVEESPAGAELTLIHHLDDPGAVGSIGPGWEYYLDMLVASRESGGLPDFDDYYPAQADYFTGQVG